MKAFSIFLLFVLLSGCYREEQLVPTKLETITDKFDFPQGNTPADQIFAEIYKKYGVKVIYKDFTNSDITRSWMSATGSSIIPVEYRWSYQTDEQLLEASAIIFQQKVFPLLPESMVKSATQAYPYMYLIDELHATMNPGLRLPLYPINALDGITVCLIATAGPDHFPYRVFFPLRIVLEYFMFAFNRGMMNLPDSFYDDIGDVSSYLYTAYSWANTMPDRYDHFWARQGVLPLVSIVSGRLYIGKNTGFLRGSAIPPLTGRDWDVPYFFMYLCLDKHWKTRFDAGQIFEDCPRLERRLYTFYNSIKEFGIDFEGIHEKLFEGTTIDTSPDRIWVQNESTGDINTYIYYDLNNYVISSN